MISVSIGHTMSLPGATACATVGAGVDATRGITPGACMDVNAGAGVDMSVGMGAGMDMSTGAGAGMDVSMGTDAGTDMGVAGAGAGAGAGTGTGAGASVDMSAGTGMGMCMCATAGEKAGMGTTEVSATYAAAGTTPCDVAGTPANVRPPTLASAKLGPAILAESSHNGR